MIRVLQVMGSMNRGGAETMVMNLFRTIDRTIVVFDFVCFSDQPFDYEQEITDLGGKIIRIVEKSDPTGIKRAFRLYQFLKSNKQYQSIHSHTLFSTGFHLLAARLAGVKVRIAHAHNTSDKKGKSVLRSIYHTIARQMIKLSATDLAACGEAAGKFVFGNTKRPVILINNAVRVQEYVAARNLETSRFRDELQIDRETLLLAQIGTINRVKNQSFSLEIAKELRKINSNFVLAIIGCGDQQAEEICRRTIAENELETQVRMLGLRDDIPSILGTADVLLMPSLHEGFPVVLVESQAAGVPALISDSISEEVDLGVDLITFLGLEQKPKFWAEQILKIASAPKNDQSTTAEILINKGFDTSTTIDLLYRLYR